MGVTARMKIIMAVLFLTIAFLSQSWGKHLLVETDDTNNGDDIDGLDTNNVDAETLIYTMFKEEELDGFESLSAKKQKKIIKDINNIYKSSRKKRQGFQHWSHGRNQWNCWRREKG